MSTFVTPICVIAVVVAWIAWVVYNTVQEETWKYRIEQWDAEYSDRQIYVAFVRSRRRWCELGRYETVREAEAACRKHEQPTPAPRLYTAESIMSDGGL